MGLVPAGASATQGGSVTIKVIHPKGAHPMHAIKVTMIRFAVQLLKRKTVLNGVLFVRTC